MHTGHWHVHCPFLGLAVRHLCHFLPDLKQRSDLSTFRYSLGDREAAFRTGPGAEWFCTPAGRVCSVGSFFDASYKKKVKAQFQTLINNGARGGGGVTRIQMCYPPASTNL